MFVAASSTTQVASKTNPFADAVASFERAQAHFDKVQAGEVSRFSKRPIAEALLDGSRQLSEGLQLLAGDDTFGFEKGSIGAAQADAEYLGTVLRLPLPLTIKGAGQIGTVIEQGRAAALLGESLLTTTH